MSNNVALVPQDKSNACWLAGATMMRSWRNQQCYTLATTLSYLDANGGSLRPVYNADNGLSFDGSKQMVSILGLTLLPPASYTIDYFFTVLASSPILAVIMYSATSNIAHMVVISDIAGDRTPDGTKLLINDPLPLNTGHTYSISFSDFLSKFEAVVAFEGKLGVQNLISQLYYYASSSSCGSSSSTGGSSSDDDAGSSGSTGGSADDGGSSITADNARSSTDNSGTDED